MTSTVDLLNDTRQAAPQNAAKPDNNKTTDRSDAFASLLRGKVPHNITFSRVEFQLEVPRSASSDRPELPVEVTREDRAREDVYSGEEPEEVAAAQDDPAETQDATTDTNSAQAAANQSSNAALNTLTNANAEKAAKVTTDTTVTQTQQVASVASSVSQQTGDAVKGEVTKDQGPKLAATQTDSKQQTATVAQTGPQVVTDEAARAAKKAVKAGDKGGIQATKTEQAVAQPASALTSNAAQTTQNVQKTNISDGRPTATDLANAAVDAEIALGTDKAKPRSVTPNQAARLADRGNTEPTPQPTVQPQPDPAANMNVQRAAAPVVTAPSQAPLPTAPTGTPAAAQAVGPTAGDGGIGGPSASSSAANAQAAARAAAQKAAASRPAMPTNIVTDQVAVHVNRAVGQGLDRINIQMRPSELGRVDVRMELAQDGRATAVISVEKQETFDMLRADNRSLLEALQNAGLEVDQDSLSFNLKGQNGQGAADLANSNRSGAGVEGEEADTDDALSSADDGMLAAGEAPEIDEDGHYDVRA